jgi:hypothetical protein
VDWPLALTPVTQVNRPRGMATSIFRRLFPEAPRKTSQPLASGIGDLRRPGHDALGGKRARRPRYVSKGDPPIAIRA